jgi:predicted P-loop ATPase/GTPase
MIDKQGRLHVVWLIYDVISRAKEQGIKVSRKQANDVLEMIDHNHDCNIGITWDVLDYCTDDVLERQRIE